MARQSRWILKDDNDNTIGRIAAFIDNVRSAANRQPTGGIGFFEVIENREAAFILFDTAREWLTQGHGSYGWPINFGENEITGDFLLKDSCSRDSECHTIKSITEHFLKNMDSGNILNNIHTTGI